MIMRANTVPQLLPPWTVLVVLVFVLALSVLMFVALVRRWTHSRIWVSISDWAHARGFRASVKECPAPPPLDALRNTRMLSQVCVSDGTSSLMRLKVLGETSGSQQPNHWHVLVRQIESPWQPTALRPASAPSSLLDLFSLTSFPLMGETQRFVVFGTDSSPARKLSKSRVRALLPPDVGLLLHGSHLILDFSQRPFDEIEFDRMIALAEQLVANLPVPTGR
ncbi:MAG TPA: hypothetical protein VGR35_17495 [Tepidisphaeraceae bacterium]|nr:hypothetical protein [Tepidisphaeraceae bacterium]